MRKFPLFKSREQAPGVGLVWLDATCLFGFGDGTMIAVETAKKKPIWTHKGSAGLLELVPLAAGQGALGLSMAGEVFELQFDGQTRPLWRSQSGWADVLAVAEAETLLAIGEDKSVVVLDTQSQEVRLKLEAPKAVTALAFGASDRLLAAAHSQGVSLYDLSTGELVAMFPVTGGPLSVWISPDGSSLLAGLAEPSLVGWRIESGQAFKMGGYPGKPKQFSWHAGTQTLYTSGGPALLGWPFQTASGPSGQAAAMLRTRLGLVTALEVAGDLALVGYSDRGVDLIALPTGAFEHIAGPSPPKELSVDPRLGQSQVVKVGLSADRRHAAWVDETGRFGIARVG